MTNLSVQFQYPWLLLLLIPAVFFTLLFYFMRDKKFRRTRNRIVSIVLHTVVMTLCILTLSGTTFTYEKSDMDNEVILLVDVTDSTQSTEDARNEFMQEVIVKSGKKCKIGIVTFGYDQVYAVPLTTNVDRVFAQYLDSLENNSPNTSATDIASALTYTKGLFTNPQMGKIVLITDGMETDNSAMAVVKSVAAEGIKLDTVRLAPTRDFDVQIVDIEAPTFGLARNKEFEITVTLQSNFYVEGEIRMYDYYVVAGASEGTEDLVEKREVEFAGGNQTFTFTHSLSVTGLHRISFEIFDEFDDGLNNNSYCTYIDFELYNKLLIIDRYEGLSDNLVDVLNDNVGSIVNGVPIPAYDVEVVTIDDERLPRTLTQLREYDQIILNNVAHGDMPTATAVYPDFEEILYAYVNEWGGGLLTISGTESANYDAAHAFTRGDMYGTLYQEMLPVEIVNYTPPIGVVIIVDRSGSMMDDTGVIKSTGGTYSKLELAKEGAKACLNALSYRDQVGIMSLEDSYSTEVNVVPRTRERELINAIDSIEIGGGTNYTPALNAASEALKNLGDSVANKHVLLVTDGGASDFEQYYLKVKEMYEKQSITFSAVAIAPSKDDASNLNVACKDGGGEFYNVTDPAALIEAMREALAPEEITDLIEGVFTPKISDVSAAAVSGIDESLIPELGGYFGTRAKDGASVALMSDFAPLYAQWQFGKGNVGSFLCDLTGEGWSRNFLSDEVGQQIIYNIVDNLFATSDIRDKGIGVYLKEGNYSSELSVFLTNEPLYDGQTLTVTVTSDPVDGAVLPTTQQFTFTAADSISKIHFNTFDAGIYTIAVEIWDEAGVLVKSYVLYKAFSYSAEYDAFAKSANRDKFLGDLAENGNGEVIELGDPAAVYDNFVKTASHSYDPTILFISLSIVLFLLDIAVRKFKWKWLHEIIRDKKAKEEMQTNQAKGGQE